MKIMKLLPKGSSFSFAWDIKLKYGGKGNGFKVMESAHGAEKVSARDNEIRGGIPLDACVEE